MRTTEVTVYDRRLYRKLTLGKCEETILGVGFTY